jgi:TPR repeat protein
VISENEITYDNLGICYELGMGVNEDKIKAFEFYEKSAEKGHVNATFHLGYCYVNGIGTKINKEKGFELFDVAVEKRSIYAQNKKEVVNDLNEVKHLYQKLAENDNEVAFLCKLGEIYESGKGVIQNKVRAFNFYKQAAEMGYTNGKYKLGYYFLHGFIVDIDKKKAFNLYKEAAEEGNGDAQKSLALLYEQGEGIEKDINSAIYWYKKCLDNGCLDVKESLDILLEQQEIQSGIQN